MTESMSEADDAPVTTVGERVSWPLWCGGVAVCLFFALQVPFGIMARRFESFGAELAVYGVYSVATLAIVTTLLANVASSGSVYAALHLTAPPPMRLRGVWKVLLVSACAYVALSYDLRYLYDAWGVETVQPLVGRVRSVESPGMRILALFVVAGLVPVVEEVVFRGALYLPLRRRVGVVSATVLTAILFAAGHGYVWGFAQLWLLGVIFVALLEHTRSLWPAIAAHAANNGITLAIIWLLPR